MKTEILILLKRSAIRCSCQIAFLIFTSPFICHAQKTTIEQAKTVVTFCGNVKKEARLSTMQYSNSSSFARPSGLLSEKSTIQDSLRVKRQFANSITGFGYILRSTKMSQFNLQMPNIHQLRVFGLNYEHKIYKHITLGMGYSEWMQFDPWPWHNGNYVELNGVPVIQVGHERGAVEELRNYRMLDFYGKFCLKYRHHQINAGLGISYTWGTNIVIDTIYVSPIGNYVISHHEWANYEGVLAFVGYDYSLFHDRFSIGYLINWRDYFRMYSPQLQNGLSIKFNF